MKCKYEGTGVWAGRCTGTKEVEPCIGHEKCSRFKGDYTTNADRIRAMTDEELAEFLCSVYDEEPVDGYKFDHAKFIEGYTIPDYDEDRIKDWLQQPCGGADHA